MASTIWEERPDTQDHGTAKIRNLLSKIVGVLAASSEQGAVTPYFLASSPLAAAVYELGYWDRRVKRVPSQPVLDDKLCAEFWGACTGDGEAQALEAAS